MLVVIAAPLAAGVIYDLFHFHNRGRNFSAAAELLAEEVDKILNEETYFPRHPLEDAPELDETRAASSS